MDRLPCRRRCELARFRGARLYNFKVNSLPRQARDKHVGRALKNDDRFSSQEVRRLTEEMEAAVRTTPVFALPFLYKSIILPSQARDRHREDSQKRGCFSQAHKVVVCIFALGRCAYNIPGYW